MCRRTYIFICFWGICFRISLCVLAIPIAKIAIPLHLTMVRRYLWRSVCISLLREPVDTDKNLTICFFPFLISAVESSHALKLVGQQQE